jgi:hypothetical protein
LTGFNNRPPAYCSYILRCWAEPAPGEAKSSTATRFSLEDPHTGERFGFTGPEALVQFLQAQVEAANSNNGEAGRDSSGN